MTIEQKIKQLRREIHAYAAAGRISECDERHAQIEILEAAQVILDDDPVRTAAQDDPRGEADR